MTSAGNTVQSVGFLSGRRPAHVEFVPIADVLAHGVREASTGM